MILVINYWNIENEKLSPLGELSLCKFAMAKYYKTKTIGTMRNLVAESNKNKYKIRKFFNEVTKEVCEIKDNENGCAKVEGKKNLFDISLTAAGNDYLDIKYICRNAGLTEDKNPAIPEYVEEYVKAVLGVSVEQCDRILVNVCDDKLCRHIAFVKGNVCLRLRPFGSDTLEFCLTCLNKELGFVGDDYALDLYDNSYCYSVALPYMERILGVKRDKNYIGILNGYNVGRYSFYGQIFHDLYDYWKNMNYNFDGSVRRIFPDLFAEKE